MADVKTRAYYAPYDNDYYIPDAEGEKRVGKNENWRDIEKGFYQVQAKNDEQDGRLDDVEATNEEQDTRLDAIEAKNAEQDGRLDNIEAKDEEQDGRLDAIEAKDEEQDGRLDAIEAVNTQQNLDIQTNRTNITGLGTRLTSAEALLNEVAQTSVENSAAIAQLETDQQTLSGRLDTANVQLADNSARLTRAENNITTLQGDAAQASQDITALQGRATAAENDIDALETDVTSLQGDIGALGPVGKVFLGSKDITIAPGITSISLNGEIQNTGLANGTYKCMVYAPYVTTLSKQYVFSMGMDGVLNLTVRNGSLSFGSNFARGKVYSTESSSWNETVFFYVIVLGKVS